MGKLFKRVVIASILAGLFYFLFGFFIIQPIGKLKDGSTVLYFRLGLNSKFIASTDGILLDDDGETAVGKLIELGRYGKRVNERKIASFPYSRLMHRYATSGRVFE